MNNIYIIQSSINFEEDIFDSDYELTNYYQLIFSDLEIAKNELKKIHNKTKDFKYYGFKIWVYTLKNNKYEKTNESYTYRFDNFTKHCS